MRSESTPEQHFIQRAIGRNGQYGRFNTLLALLRDLLHQAQYRISYWRLLGGAEYADDAAASSWTRYPSLSLGIVHDQVASRDRSERPISSTQGGPYCGTDMSISARGRGRTDG